MTWLIFSRAVQGIGAGGMLLCRLSAPEADKGYFLIGIYPMVQIVIGDIVSLEE
jgi:MFS family permease